MNIVRKNLFGILILSVSCFSGSFAYAQAFDLNETNGTNITNAQPAPSKQVPVNLNPQDTSLTDYVQSGETTAENSKENSENKNWVSKAFEKGAEVISAPTKAENTKRSNASVFDITGVMLRMSVQQVSEAMTKRGYQKTTEKMDIPNFVRWRYEETCRNQGVVGFERIGACVIQLSKKNGFQYVQQLTFNSFRTKESMDVYFTSNFTGNKVYRIVYHTEAANITGSGAKADYLRNIKVFDFWKKINQKYGIPDNQEQAIWGMGDNKPYMQASTGNLMLYDPMLLELDYARMSREDQRFMNTAVYTF